MTKIIIVLCIWIQIADRVIDLTPYDLKHK